eukprot:3872950-Heterocapsa_arctica.AAC.1
MCRGAGGILPRFLRRFLGARWPRGPPRERLSLRAARGCEGFGFVLQAAGHMPRCTGARLRRG